MHAELNEIDSQALGRNVVDIHDFDDSVPFSEYEAAAVLPLKPALVFCKVPAENVAAIHTLEEHGFRYAETQLVASYRLRRRPAARHPYEFALVESEYEIEQALALADSIFTHDRYSTDPAVDAGVSGRRYQAYVRKSLRAADERVYVMKNIDTRAIVSLATIRMLDPSTARLLIGGVANELKGSGIGAVHDEVGLQTYYDLGIRLLRTAMSAINYPIINLEISHLGFRLDSTFVVLRKAC